MMEQWIDEMINWYFDMKRDNNGQEYDTCTIRSYNNDGFSLG